MKSGSGSSLWVPVPFQFTVSGIWSSFRYCQSVGFPFPFFGKFMIGCAWSIAGWALKVIVVRGWHRFGRQCWSVQLFREGTQQIVWFRAFLNCSSERVQLTSFWFGWACFRDHQCWDSFWFSLQNVRLFLKLFLWGWVSFRSFSFLWSFSIIEICNYYELLNCKCSIFLSDKVKRIFVCNNKVILSHKEIASCWLNKDEWISRID